MTLPVAPGSEPVGMRDPLQRLHALTTVLAGAHTVAEVATVIIDRVPPALAANAAVLGMLSDDGQIIHTVRVTGFPAESVAEQAPCSIDDGYLLSDAARAGACIILETRAQRIARYPSHATLGAPGGDGAALAAPMMVGGRVIGVIGLSFAHDRVFDADTRTFIEVIAGQCALAWERAREYDAARFELQERRRAEDALRASEARLRAALNAAQMGAFTIDLDSGQVDASDSTRHLFGLPPAPGAPHLLAQYLARVHPEDRPTLTAVLKRMAGGGEEQAAEFRVPLPDGTERCLLARGGRVRDAAGAGRLVAGAVLDITRRRQTEAELERTAGQLRTVLDHLPVAVWLTDRDGTILQDNPAGERIWGRRFWERGHVGATRAWLVDSGQEITAGEWSLARALSDGVATRDELVEIERADGERRTILSSCLPVRDAAGQVLGAVVLNEDITERRRAERQARFQAAALADAGDAVIATDAEERVTYWNSGAERLYGLPASVMVGRPLALAYRPVWPSAAIEAEAQAVLARAGRWLGETVHLMHDGSERVIDASITLIRDAQGRPAGHLAVNRDITARRQMEARLRESEERLRLALLARPVTLFAQDRALRYTFLFNPSSGIAPESVLGRADDELLSPAYAEPLTALKRQVLASGRPVRMLIASDGSGSLRWFDLMLEPERDAGGAITGITGVAVDVTERRRAEAERDALLAGLTHDLKNPLAAIRGLAQLAARASHGSPAVAESIAGITTATQRMAIMLDDFLDLARAQSGRPLELERQPADLVALVDAAVREAGRTTDHHIRLAREAAALPGAWDTGRLERVAANVLSNAVKFSPETSTITVRLWRDGGDACLSVVDEGEGIPAADLPRVFEPFFRARTVAGRVPGSGLGLASARQIIEQHGGSMTVESREGAGTTVTIRLPLSPP